MSTLITRIEERRTRIFTGPLIELFEEKVSWWRIKK